MLIDSINITVEIQNTGVRRLLVQGRPMGLAVKISLAELDQLIRELAQEAQAWRTSLLPDHYHTLGVERTATLAEIKRAFRRLARRYHPDLHNGARHAEMMHVNAAYEVLRDVEKRKKFDSSIS